MNRILIKNATIINENNTFLGDVLIENEFIKQVTADIKSDETTQIIDAKGCYLIPGFIDDQVHFREPGLTHKATIATESKAAAAGGITSFIEQPNTVPNATTQKLLEDKFEIASKTSFVNYSFMFGGTNDNLEELLKTDPKKVAGIKLFLGSSTGNMLVDDVEVLEKIFSSTKMIISVHCEDEATIRKNTAKFTEIYGEDIPVKYHPIIRSEESCFISSSKAIELAKKTGARLHIFHVSTEKETHLFRNDIPLEEKQITAEVCIHHLWFNDTDYDEKGTLIKWNPAVKTEKDRLGLWKALLDDRIDVLATDHAPHTLDEKSNNYKNAPSGGPLVQHAVLAILEKVKEGVIPMEKAVEKMSHNPAKLFQIEKRGFIKEGYFADLVLIDPNSPQTVTKDTLLYKCGWSPFEGTTFSHTITHTFVNGNLVYENGKINENIRGKRLTFNR
ncbi:dihydroorotase [Polaribacter sp. BAL334]|uniref:dihydroorotase n=1 Tax=Polaribacter sp. BAL334 TaxID=1708178 RepID=UPI0018D2197F|nr:dihydroorotase [Polaribacter sp. BAL334]MBG7612042.1 dihydroorotase [Polaribacter sp. BAL334]